MFLHVLYNLAYTLPSLVMTRLVNGFRYGLPYHLLQTERSILSYRSFLVSLGLLLTGENLGGGERFFGFGDFDLFLVLFVFLFFYF